MNQLVVSVVGGLSLGALYSLIGLGLVLCFRATEAFNFAHGQFMLLPAFLVAKWQSETDLPFVLIVVLSLSIVGAIGALLYALVLRKTVGRQHFVIVIATLGFAAIADGVMNIMFGTQTYNIRTPGLPRGSIEILGTRFGKAGLVITAFSIVLALAIVVAISVTTLGIKIRAAGQDALLASQGGVNVHWIYMGSWAGAAVLGGVAGIAYGSTNIVSVQIVDLALLAAPAILLGGFDSIPGAVLGGMVVGIIQSFVASYYGGEYVNVVTYASLLGFMLLLPYGFLGTRKISRV